MSFKFIKYLVLILTLSSCRFNPLYWQMGGPYAIPIVGLDKKSKEQVRYISERDYRNQVGPSVAKVTKGMVHILEKGDREGRWQFGQLAFGLKFSLDLGFSPIYSLNVSPSVEMIYRKRKFIY